MPTAPPQLVITIAPDRDGTHSILVSLRNANGAQSPPRRISVDYLGGRLGAFVGAAQALARQQVAPIESPAARPDGDPAIASNATDGEQGR